MYISRIDTRIGHLTRDDRGQDLLEYAMLTALVALLGIAAWGLIGQRVGQAYTAYDTGTQGLWEPPDPAGGGS